MSALLRLSNQAAASRPLLEFELINLLRAIARWKASDVFGRTWYVQEIETFDYQPPPRGLVDMAVFTDDSSVGVAILEGERLLERSALIGQVETGFVFRVKKGCEPVGDTRGLPAWNGPAYVQLPGCDLEIRMSEVRGFEIVTEEVALLEYLSETARWYGLRSEWER